MNTYTDITDLAANRKVVMTNTFARANGMPIDNTTIFNNKDTLRAYTDEGNAYEGQVVAVREEINNEYVKAVNFDQTETYYQFSNNSYQLVANPSETDFNNKKTTDNCYYRLKKYKQNIYVLNDDEETKVQKVNTDVVFANETLKSGRTKDETDPTNNIIQCSFKLRNCKFRESFNNNELLDNKYVYLSKLEMDIAHVPSTTKTTNTPEPDDGAVGVQYWTYQFNEADFNDLVPNDFKLTRVTLIVHRPKNSSTIYNFQNVYLSIKEENSQISFISTTAVSFNSADDPSLDEKTWQFNNVQIDKSKKYIFEFKQYGIIYSAATIYNEGVTYYRYIDNSYVQVAEPSYNDWSTNKDTNNRYYIAVKQLNNAVFSVRLYGSSTQKTKWSSSSALNNYYAYIKSVGINTEVNSNIAITIYEYDKNREESGSGNIAYCGAYIGMSTNTVSLNSASLTPSTFNFPFLKLDVDKYYVFRFVDCMIQNGVIIGMAPTYLAMPIWNFQDADTIMWQASENASGAISTIISGANNTPYRQNAIPRISSLYIVKQSDIKLDNDIVIMKNKIVFKTRNNEQYILTFANGDLNCAKIDIN